MIGSTGKTLRSAFGILVLAGLLTGVTAAARSQDVRSLLPGALESGAWTLRDTVRVVQGEDLFDLIDGGADIFLEYGFKRVAVGRYRDTAGGKIDAEIYEMTDPDAAYGVFSIKRGSTGKSIPLGNEGLAYDYYLMFWKARFVVFVSTADTSRDAAGALTLLSTAIETRITPGGNTPTLVQMLPQDGVQSTAFLRGPVALMTRYAFGTGDIFRVREGAVGQYVTHTLFVFRYEDGMMAKAALRNARASMLANKKYSGGREEDDRFSLIDRDNRPLCIQQKGRHVIVVLANNAAVDPAAICVQTAAGFDQ